MILTPPPDLKPMIGFGFTVVDVVVAAVLLLEIFRLMAAKSSFLSPSIRDECLSSILGGVPCFSLLSPSSSLMLLSGGSSDATTKEPLDSASASDCALGPNLSAVVISAEVFVVVSEVVVVDRVIELLVIVVDVVVVDEVVAVGEVLLLIVDLGLYELFDVGPAVVFKVGGTRVEVVTVGREVIVEGDVALDISVVVDVTDVVSAVVVEISLFLILFLLIILTSFLTASAASVLPLLLLLPSVELLEPWKGAWVVLRTRNLPWTLAKSESLILMRDFIFSATSS